MAILHFKSCGSNGKTGSQTPKSWHDVRLREQQSISRVHCTTKVVQSHGSHGW